MRFERPNDQRPLALRADTPICAAPFVAMEFDQFGDVQACCANALYPLGNVGRSSLREIWHGERAVALRTALLRGDLSYGCGVCRHRLDGKYGELPRDYYDNFPFTSTTPDWPHSLQFSLHNTCNLECVMCGADRSSKIRSRRANLEPLPHVYDDSFFEQLQPFLEHCGAADFSGGEPFLIAEHFRVWDQLMALERQPLCSLTTNGTVWNERVEQVLDGLDLHISVSMDGITRQTFEAIRVGADFDVVMANLDRFARYTAERGTELAITWSLVRQNWFELGDMMRFAEERGIRLKVQTVIEPEYGVQRMPTPELAFVVESLEAEGRKLAPTLHLNRQMWDREVQRLRGELESRADGGLRPMYMEPPSTANIPHVAQMISAVDDVPNTDTLRERILGLLRPSHPNGTSTTRAATATTATTAATERERGTARNELRAWSGGRTVGEITIDERGHITGRELAGVFPEALDTVVEQDPTTFTEFLAALESSVDGQLWIGEEFVEPHRVSHTLWIGRAVRDKTGLIIRLISLREPAGVRVLVAADPSFLPATTNGVRVSLTSRPTRKPANADVVAGSSGEHRSG